VEANNAASQVFNYTATGAVAANTVLIGPIECDRFRQITLHSIALGTSSTLATEISNDATAGWVSAPFITQAGGIGGGSTSVAGMQAFDTLGSRFLRVRQNAAQTAGTTTLVAYASQQATPKLYQQVAVTGTPTVNAQLTQIGGVGSPVRFTLVSAASTNATSVKTSASNVAWMQISNTTASWRFVKMYNRNSAPTVGTDTPVFNLAIAPNSTIDHACAFLGMAFGSGVALAITGGSALLDATAVGSGDVVVNISYL
jgi:hypothetical protein